MKEHPPSTAGLTAPLTPGVKMTHCAPHGSLQRRHLHLGGSQRQRRRAAELGAKRFLMSVRHSILNFSGFFSITSPRGK